MQRKGERQTMTGKEYCRYIRTYSELEVLEDVHQPYRLLPEAQQPADIHPESGCFCGIC